jgi:hypothetical protein
MVAQKLPIYAPELRTRYAASSESLHSSFHGRSSRPIVGIQPGPEHANASILLSSKRVCLAPGLSCRKLGLFRCSMLFRVDLEEVV